VRASALGGELGQHVRVAAERVKLEGVALHEGAHAGVRCQPHAVARRLELPPHRYERLQDIRKLPSGSPRSRTKQNSTHPSAVDCSTTMAYCCAPAQVSGPNAILHCMWLHWRLEDRSFARTCMSPCVPTACRISSMQA